MNTFLKQTFLLLTKFTFLIRSVNNHYNHFIINIPAEINRKCATSLIKPSHLKRTTKIFDIYLFCHGFL